MGSFHSLNFILQRGDFINKIPKAPLKVLIPPQLYLCMYFEPLCLHVVYSTQEHLLLLLKYKPLLLLPDLPPHFDVVIAETPRCDR